MTGRLSGCTSISSRHIYFVLQSQGDGLWRKGVINSPSYVTILLICDFLPEGNAITSSPLRIIPEATLPQNHGNRDWGARRIEPGNENPSNYGRCQCTVSRKSEVKYPHTKEYVPISPPHCRHPKLTAECSLRQEYPMGYKLPVFIDYLIKTFFGKIHQVHLIDSKHHMLDAKQRHQKVCRRVCVMTPIRASTRIIAKLAVEPR